MKGRVRAGARVGAGVRAREKGRGCGSRGGHGTAALQVPEAEGLVRRRQQHAAAVKGELRQRRRGGEPVDDAAWLGGEG